MSYLKRLFSCGDLDANDQPLIPLPGLCVARKTKPATDLSKPPVNMQNSIKTISTDTYAYLQPVKTAKRRSLPSMNFIALRDHRAVKSAKMDLGFMVGVINTSKQNHNILPRDCMKVYLGKRHEISALTSLRPRALDSVIAFWSVLGC
jgi:hypothetical protein